MKLFSITDVGRRRELNEDYIFTSDKPVGNLPNLFIVADGMGGHNAGDYASKHAVEKVVEAIRDNKDEYDRENLLREAILAANNYLYDMSIHENDKKGMGTTLVAITVHDGDVLVANVGDSRMYVISDFITQITKDHSYVEEMVDMGELTRESARNHPDKNIITRAVGVSEFADVNDFGDYVDFFYAQITEKEKLLLCTDGLTNMLTDDEIKSIVTKADDLEQAGKKLIKEANNKGGRDNIAVVLVEPFGGQND